MHRTRPTFRSTVATLAAAATLVGGLVALTPTAQASAPTGAPASARASTPLPPALEEIRAAEATRLYGDPAERPPDQRKSGLISLGDSEISGEGVGTYEPGTNGPDNWCHRSPDAAIHRTGIAADVTYNVSCSGASTVNVRVGGTPQYADELVQSDSLAIKARNTRIKMVVLVAGANDDLQFGPVITDCVLRWFTLQGPCVNKYRSGWQARVDGLVPKIESTVGDLRGVMRGAGYADGDYKLVVMGYPGPLTPDYADNPNFPGKIPGGCTGYDEDAAWARDGAVPAFQSGVRKAAANSGAVYLDNSRLFHGHEVCTDDDWARGLFIDLGTFPPSENSLRQSFHPNAAGHVAFASCLTQLYDSGLGEASCADPASTGRPLLQPGSWDDAFRPLKNEGTGTCVDVTAAKTRNGSKVTGYGCHDARNQGWWYDTSTGAGARSLHSELSHDRCLDVPSGTYRAGAALTLWDCHGGANQKFVNQSGTIRPASAGTLCLTLASAQDPLRLQNCDGSANQRFV
ncbi:ricin-type beta-trefoil lectin domain protein [Streptomyces niveus]|uniref:Ricin-type beta-trefoil lectin domain protein n=1 Tax=Streptomyces niveus TaxID=193462 RepID=A0ABZ2A3R5_STRNV|nr:ricin-type beta-trefoil lectin domain protein [Streptomyces niveus]